MATVGPRQARPTATLHCNVLRGRVNTMNHFTTNRIGRHVLLGLAALAALLGAADAALAQSVPNDQRLIQHIQPRGYSALHKAKLSEASAEKVLLDQRWAYEWNGGNWGHSSQTLFVYNQGNRTEEWLFVWNGSVMMNQTRTTYQLTGSEMLVELYEEYDVVKGEFHETDRYTYGYMYDLFTGEPLFLVSMVYETKAGDDWLPVERTTYEQVSESELLTTVHDWDGAEWTPLQRITMVDTPQGVVETEERRSGTGFEPFERTTFPGETIESLREISETFMNSFIDYAGLYYSAHLVPNFLSEAWNGIGWVFTERKIDLLLNPDHGSSLYFGGALYESYSDGTWAPEQRQITAYRMSDDRPVKSSLDFNAGTTWTTMLVETFEHDGLGDLTTATQQVDQGAGLENSLQLRFLWEHIHVGVEDDEMPGGYALDGAFPNPFNPSTTVQYRLASAGRVAIQVYDALGRHVATLFEGNQIAGTHEITFEATGLSSGVYLVRLDAPGFTQSRTVTLLK